MARPTAPGPAASKEARGDLLAILRNLRREWRTYLSQRLWILGVLLLALCALALVQYHWIEQVAQAEHQRAKTNLTTALLDLASDFDIEITRVFATFQLPATSPADYSERYKQWLGRAPYPGLVRGVYILETKKTPSALRAVIPAEPAIASNAWQPALTRLALPLGVVTAVDPPGSADGSQLSSQGAIVSIAGSSSLDTTIDGNPVFVFPIVPAMNHVTTLAANRVQGTAPAFATMAVEGERVVGPVPPFEWVVVVLEASYIRETLIPRLLQIHFPNGSLADYDILVVSKKVFLPSRTIFHSQAAPPESRFGQPDGTVNLYALRMDCFVRSSAGDTGVAATRILQLGPRPSRPWFASSGAEIVRTGPQAQMPIGVDRLSEILAPTRPNCSQPAPASGGNLAGSWEMLVRYRAGSLDQAMATFRRRSILMSCSVLLVLALGILMLVVLTERARSLAEMQAEFVLGVSHELRTPLTVIRLAADNLKKGMVEGPEKAQNYGEIIGTHAAELSKMIEETLTFARAQSTTFLGKRALVSPAEIASASVANCETALRHAGIELELHLAADLPLVDVDLRLFGKCLENLIQNVAKYAALGRWMAIRVHTVSRPEGERVEISVEDRGPGISAVDLPHVFEPFYRGKQGEISQVPGVGLGLTLVRRVVEAHDGTVEVESAAGSGAIFSIFLPPHCARLGNPKEA